jgi:hypothetical protein
MINFKFNLPLFLLILFSFLFSLGIYYSPMSYLTFKDLHSEFLDPLKENKDATYIIGSSRIRDLEASIFNERKNNVVNTGINGASFMTNFFITLYVLENSSPKNILFEITPYGGIHFYSVAYYHFELFDAFDATNFSYLDYVSFIYNYMKNTENITKQGYFRYSNHFSDYIRTFDFSRFLKSTEKKTMIKQFRGTIGNGFLASEKNSDLVISDENFKSIKRTDFGIENTSQERPIEYYFIQYLNDIAAKKGVDIKYVIPLTYSFYKNSTNQLYNQGIKGVHTYDKMFLDSIYKKENFYDPRHLNRRGLDLFYNEVFN